MIQMSKGRAFPEERRRPPPLHRRPRYVLGFIRETAAMHGTVKVLRMP
jgi:hypothetical protein